MKQQTTGIFIHKTPYSESSLITTFYTQDAGLQRFLFQGGKKKSAGLFPCSICELTFYRRPDSELGKLTEVEILQPLQRISSDPVYGTVAYFFADILRNTLKNENKDDVLFDFLKTYIITLDALEQSELSIAVVHFLLKLTVHLGIDPQASTPVKTFFLINEGTFSDLDRKDTLTRSGEGVALIQNLLLRSSSQEINHQAIKEALEILLVYFQQHIPSFNVTKSLEIIREFLYQ